MKLTKRRWSALSCIRLEARIMANMINGRRCTREFIDQMQIELSRENRDVRGNRHPALPFTWDDARLCLESTLKKCLELLEER